MLAVDQFEIKDRVGEIASRWPAVGLAVVTRQAGAGTTAVHLDFGPLSFQKQPGTTNLGV